MAYVIMCHPNHMRLLPAVHRRPMLIMEKVIIPDDSSGFKASFERLMTALIIQINVIIDDEVFIKV